LLQIASPHGRWIKLTYDSLNRITRAEDNIGRVVQYTYDTIGRLWKVTDVAGGVTEYSYDPQHRMLTIKDPRNIVYLTNEYDANGRVSKQTQADKTTYQFAYTLDGSGKVTQTDVTNPRGFLRRVTLQRGRVCIDGYASRRHASGAGDDVCSAGGDESAAQCHRCAEPKNDLRV
jgi:YD repeat-containing protein